MWTIFSENLAHFTHGAALMFFISLCVRIYPLRKENNLMRILFFSMALMVFLELKDIVYLIEGVWYDSYLSKLCMCVDMLYVPMMAIFFFETLSPGWTTIGRAVYLFSGQLLAGIVFAVTGEEIIFRISMLYALIFGAIVVVIVFLASSRHDNYIKNNFSYTENISAQWTRTAILALFVSLSVWTLLLWEDNWFSDAAYYVVSIAVWAYISACSLKYKVIEIPQTIGVSYRKEDSAVFDENHAMYEKKLRICMDEERIYLNPKLTLQDAASAVGTNRTYLSDYLNKTLHTTFYEYVNGFRVAMACELMKAPSNSGLSLSEIAEMSGFNSMSTFNRAFHKVTGMTPSFYIKSGGTTDSIKTT